LEILINELSIHQQFKSIDDFTLSLLDTIKLYQEIRNKRYTISKKSDFWNYKPTLQCSLNDILKKKGNDHVTKYKSILATIISQEPFWDNDQKHSNSDIYKCEHTSLTSDYAIAESCERNCLVISFLSDKFVHNEITVDKNGQDRYSVQNFSTKEHFLDYFIKVNLDYFIPFCKNRFKDHKVDFVTKNNNYCIQPFLDSINDKEKEDIINDIKNIILNYLDQKKPLPENISKHLTDDVFELRVSSNNKIFRLFYYYSENKTIVFTHGFIKKTMKTPAKEITRAIILKKYYQNNK